MSASSFTGHLCVRIKSAEGLEPTAFIQRLPGITLTTLDPYAEVSVDDRILGKTTTKPKTLSPVWEQEEFREPVRKTLDINIFRCSSCISNYIYVHILSKTAGLSS